TWAAWRHRSWRQKRTRASHDRQVSLGARSRLSYSRKIGPEPPLLGHCTSRGPPTTSIAAGAKDRDHDPASWPFGHHRSQADHTDEQSSAHVRAAGDGQPPRPDPSMEPGPSSELLRCPDPSRRRENPRFVAVDACGQSAEELDLRRRPLSATAGPVPLVRLPWYR